MDAREIRRTLRKVERLFGLRRNWLRKIAQIESAMKPSAVNPRSGAAGIFQFLSTTATEENINPMDVIEASVATAKRLRRFGVTYARIDPTVRKEAAELTAFYLSHQQGVVGIHQILHVAAFSHISLTPGRLRNMEANFPGSLSGDTDQEKARAFLAFWDDKLASA